MATSYYAELFILHKVRFRFQYGNGIGTGIGIRFFICDGVFTLPYSDSYTDADNDSCSEKVTMDVNEMAPGSVVNGYFTENCIVVHI